MVTTMDAAFYVRNDSNIIPQLYETFPVLAPLFPSDYEKNFRPLPSAAFCVQNMPLMIGICVAYLVMTFGGKQLMNERKPFHLKGALAAWNLLLAVFSFIGATRTLPHLLHTLATRSLFYAVCHDSYESYGSGPSGFWTMLFIFSKLPEMFDTAFIVLRKKDLTFLHWYHHLTVFAFCWHSFAVESSAGQWFISMNYTVHAVMYFYYFLTAIGYRPPWAVAVTVMQLVQMVGGTVVLCLAAFYKSQGRLCEITDENHLFGAAIYISYFMLFAKFFAERYCCRKARSGGKRDGKQAKEQSKESKSQDKKGGKKAE